MAFKLTEENKIFLYSLWGEKDFYEEDENEAVLLAKEKFPEASLEEIAETFYDFLIDND